METEGLWSKAWEPGISRRSKDYWWRLLLGAGVECNHEEIEPPSGSYSLLKPPSSSLQTPFVLSHMPDLPDLPFNTPNSNINEDIRKYLLAPHIRGGLPGKYAQDRPNARHQLLKRKLEYTLENCASQSAPQATRYNKKNGLEWSRASCITKVDGPI